MKDWNDRLDDLDGRLDAWNGRYEDACGELLARRGGLFARFRSPGLEERDAIAREAAARAGDGPHAEVSAFLDDLCRYFLEASITERTKIRARVGASRALFEALWSWVVESPDLVRGEGAAERLRLALTGLAIDDLRVDVESVWEVLGRLWLAALRAGVEPKPIFLEVAEVANRGTGGGGAHMREILAEFDRSVHFERAVRPELNERRRAG